MLRSEGFLDTANIESSAGVTFGVTRPTKIAENPVWPTLPSDGSVPHWGAGFSTLTYDEALGKIRIHATVFDSPAVNTVHLGQALFDPVTRALTMPNEGHITFNGTTNNILCSPGGLTRNQHRVAWDDYLGAWVCITYVYVGLTPTIRIYTAPAGDPWPWTLVKTLTDPSTVAPTSEGAGVDGTCEPMAFWRRTDDRAVIYYQHTEPGGIQGIRHVGMLLGPADGSLTGTWTDQGRILTAPSADAQYYYSGAWLYGDHVIVPIGIYDGNYTPGSLVGNDDRIWKAELWVDRSSDGTTLSRVDTDWLATDGTGFDASEIIASNTMAEVGDTLWLGFGGDTNPHHVSPEGDRLYGMATVPRDRLGYIEGPGSAVLDPIAGAGTITINAVADVAVELLHPSTGAVLTGYAAADCDAIPADTYGHLVTWNGQPATPASYKPRLVLASGRVHYLTAEELAPGSMTLTPANGWTQDGLDLSVVATVGVRATVTAIVVSNSGGPLTFAGIHADRFAASLDGSTWVSTLELDAGETTIYLSALPQAGDTVLTASVGVPR